MTQLPCYARKCVVQEGRARSARKIFLRVFHTFVGGGGGGGGSKLVCGGDRSRFVGGGLGGGGGPDAGVGGGLAKSQRKPCQLYTRHTGGGNGVFNTRIVARGEGSKG